LKPGSADADKSKAGAVDADPPDDAEKLWDLEKLAKEKDVWNLNESNEYNRFVPPWMIDPGNPDHDLERWIYEGIGTVTYFQSDKLGKQGKANKRRSMIEGPKGGEAGGEVGNRSPVRRSSVVRGGAGEGDSAAAKQPSSASELVLWSEEDEKGTCLGGLTDRCPPPPSSPTFCLQAGNNRATDRTLWPLRGLRSARPHPSPR
jgi:hypothetical protein